MAHRYPASDRTTGGFSRRSSPLRVRRAVGLGLNGAPRAGEPMDQAVDPDERDPSVVAVAVASLVAGLACTLAPPPPRASPAWTDPGVVRAVGLVDLALALGLYVGRPSWPWLLARAASNPAIAAVSLASARTRRARLSLSAWRSPPPPTCGPPPGSAPRDVGAGRRLRRASQAVGGHGFCDSACVRRWPAMRSGSARCRGRERSSLSSGSAVYCAM